MEDFVTQPSTVQSRLVAGLAADDYGVDDDRAPLLLIHGLTFDRSMWRPALEALRSIDPGRRVLNVDLPGHGESAGKDSYDGESLGRDLSDAVKAAGLAEPVVVGHSAAGITATFYANRHPVRGVINVDAALQVAPFSALLHSIADKLDAAHFASVWPMFMQSMRIDLLPDSAQALLARSSTPDRDLVVGYWQDVLSRSTDELVAQLDAELSELRASGTPYTVVTGEEPSEEYSRWLSSALPQARVVAWEDSGHFPHLAHPLRFARLLAQTGGWQRPSSGD
jgi:pimeloyl-ACP methyl ester carboxylesterase